ncbi:MAG: hypothetical protein JNM17_24485 [Archangium sp.]|nr:hypothetical protein [Archangium sp.]
MDLQQVPAPPREASTNAMKALVQRRRMAMFGVLFPAVVTTGLAVWAGPQVVEDLKFDFGKPEVVKGHITATQVQKSSKGRTYAYCADFVDDEGRGLSGNTCGLPLTTQVGPVELEVLESKARVRGGRNVPEFIAGLVVFVDTIYFFVGIALWMRARRELQAMREGTAVIGTALGSQRIKSSTRVKVRYLAETEEIESSTLLPGSLEFAAGERVVVLFHPRFPKIFVLWR